MSMTPEAQSIAVARGAIATAVRDHAARYLTVADLRASDLILAMDRGHRREVVELDPSAVSRTFTLRELGRLVDGVSDFEFVEVTSPQVTASGRLTAMLALLRGRRGTSALVSSPGEDDVTDPYRRSMRTYELSADQLTSALPAVERLISFTRP